MNQPDLHIIPATSYPLALTQQTVSNNRGIRESAFKKKKGGLIVVVT